MIRNQKYFLPLVLLLLLTGGCKKYLDLKPEDSYIDEQVFSNKATIQQALNGIYHGLAADALYGANLTISATDIIAQRYNMSGVISTYLDIANSYGNQGQTGSTFDAIWTNGYALILKANNFIEQLEKTKGKGVITDAQASQLVGEVTGIRALIHFDLLRLYGPQYSGNDDDEAIPYYTKADGKLQPLLKFGEVVDMILADLADAEQMLSDDPVITNGVSLTDDVDFYASFRNRRMNYYAVKALEARIFLYVGKKPEAHAAAKTVVDASDAIFPWTNYNAIIGNGNPDRVFSSEIIFGITNNNLYNLQAQYFSASRLPSEILAPTNDQLVAAFEGNENDYRYTTTWLNSIHGFRTFYKYADLTDVTKNWRFFQPMIRKSEVYYILAETDPDHAQAVHYLNAVRYNRGLPDLPDNAPLIDYGGEIEKEYIKEFYGEGQLFFYYKRINPGWIYFPSFRVPLPISETQLR